MINMCMYFVDRELAYKCAAVNHMVTTSLNFWIVCEEDLLSLMPFWDSWTIKCILSLEYVTCISNSTHFNTFVLHSSDTYCMSYILYMYSVFTCATITLLALEVCVAPYKCSEGKWRSHNVCPNDFTVYLQSFASKNLAYWWDH